MMADLDKLARKWQLSSTQAIGILPAILIILGIHAVGEQRLNLLVIQVLTFKRRED